MGSGDNLSVIFIAFDNFFNNSEKIDEILKKIENKNCDLILYNFYEIIPPLP